MKEFYPLFYCRFRCIAAKCPDSCCRGWDVVIDKDTEDFYNSVNGSFGEMLRAAIYTDADGDRVFRLAEEKRCPFWGKDKLCDIYRELGEEHLCETCAKFPRISMDYTVFREHTLSLACPEAARLIVGTESAYTDFLMTESDECDDYSAELMNTLLNARRECADILKADKPLNIRLRELIRLNSDVRNSIYEISGEETASDCGFIFDLFSELDYIDEIHREMIVGSKTDSVGLNGAEPELTRIAIYWLYRYYLSAIDTNTVTAPTAFIICSVIIIDAVVRRYGLSVCDAAQMYSKEIEQSYENMELLWELFEDDPRFHPFNLKNMLSQQIIYN